ncbi:MAG: cbb3-type cytochrome oxidase assembly protein CcoS [bacterium]|nr:cbb3-type cytochrome oxidase assembly protein CcoS [bacterium]
MIVIFLLIGVSMLVALGFLGAFIWAQTDGQYEDDYSPSVRILYDDQLKPDDKCQQSQLNQKSPNLKVQRD